MREASNQTDSLIKSLKRLYEHFSDRRKRQLVLVLGLMLLGALAELATLGAVLPFLALIADPTRAAAYPVLQDAFRALGWTNSDDILVPATLVFAATALSSGAIRLLLAWVSQKFVFRVGYDLGVEVYQRTLHQPYSFHISRNTSEIIAGINKVQLVIVGVVLPLMQALIGVVISLFIFAALVAIDPMVALSAALGFGAMYLLVTYFTRSRLRENSAVIADAQTTRVQTVQEGLGGIRDVLIDQSQRIYLEKFARIDSAFRDAQALNNFIQAAPRFVIEALGMVLIAVLALYLSGREGGLATALPVLGALALGAQRLLPLLQLMYNGWARIAGHQHVLLDILSILDLPLHERYRIPNPEFRTPFEREISLDAVSFRYGPDRSLVLDKIGISIKKGTRVGFIGKTGSGKSTVVDLITGLLEPTEGRIRIDDRILTTDNVGGWQAQIAYVPQAIYLADTNIGENIAYGVREEDVDWDRVKDAARRAELADFIESLPESYRTLVGERGIRLSGGQRQRIGIARALYKQASVLIFDEATSALDTDTEASVMASIKSLGQDLTILLIAHRLTTVSGCDEIYEMRDGSAFLHGGAFQTDRKFSSVRPS